MPSGKNFYFKNSFLRIYFINLFKNFKNLFLLHFTSWFLYGMHIILHFHDSWFFMIIFDFTLFYTTTLFHYSLCTTIYFSNIVQWQHEYMFLFNMCFLLYTKFYVLFLLNMYLLYRCTTIYCTGGILLLARGKRPFLYIL